VPSVDRGAAGHHVIQTSQRSKITTSSGSSVIVVLGVKDEWGRYQRNRASTTRLKRRGKRELIPVPRKLRYAERAFVQIEDHMGPFLAALAPTAEVN